VAVLIGNCPVTGCYHKHWEWQDLSGLSPHQPKKFSFPSRSFGSEGEKRPSWFEEWPYKSLPHQHILYCYTPDHMDQAVPYDTLPPPHYIGPAERSKPVWILCCMFTFAIRLKRSRILGLDHSKNSESCWFRSSH
jgi:hypothetical protein